MKEINWSSILKDAIEKPGLLMEAYTRFRGYSFGNQIAAMWQCKARGITPGPIATFQRWLELGRCVRKGEKAINLCMPVTIKADPADPDGKPKTIFIWKPRWFVMAQTDGEPLDEKAFEAPNWDKARALKALDIEEIPFDYPNGNVQGYAKVGKIAINPMAQLPLKTLFHEVGHILLGHCKEGPLDHADIPPSLMEVEAEAVALCCLETLGLPGSEYARGYIQRWLHGNAIPDSSTARVFKITDTILKAGIEASHG